MCPRLRGAVIHQSSEDDGDNRVFGEAAAVKLLLAADLKRNSQFVCLGKERRVHRFLPFHNNNVLSMGSSNRNV